MKKTRNIAIILTIISVLLVIISPNVKATIDPTDYDPSSKLPTAEDVNKIVGLANPIIGTIKVVGIVAAVVTLAVIGIKYMTGSVEEKAEYKKTMIPYLIGAVLVVSITQFLGVVIQLVVNVK